MIPLILLIIVRCVGSGAQINSDVTFCPEEGMFPVELHERACSGVAPVLQWVYKGSKRICAEQAKRHSICGGGGGSALLVIFSS